MRSVVCCSFLNLMTILSRSLSGWPGWGQNAECCRRTKTTLHSSDWCQTRSVIEFLELRQHQQVAAVVTAKGRIAASTYRITLTHARYSPWAGSCPQIAPFFPWVYPGLTHNTFLGPTRVYFIFRTAPTFYRAYGCHQQTHTDTQTHWPRYIYYSGLHSIIYAMRCGLTMQTGASRSRFRLLALNHHVELVRCARRQRSEWSHLSVSLPL